MKNLSTVIRALEQCHQDIKYRDCDCCEYASAGSDCERCLMKDALELLKEYRNCLTGCGIRQYGMEGSNGTVR